MKFSAAPDIRIALVGLGHVADHQIAAIEMTDGLRLVAACDKDPSSARKLSYGMPFFSCINDLLSDGQFEIVMISTPNREHYRLGEQVIESGKALILEKPAVESRRQLDRIVRKSKHADVFVYVSLHAAFGVEVIWFQRQLANGSLSFGDLRFVRACFFDPYISDNALTNGAESLGGSWMDSGMNALSVLGKFVDPANLLIVKSHMRAPEGLNCSETEGMVSLESGQVRGLIHTSWLTGINHKSTQLIFDQDEVLLDHSRQKASRGKGENQKTIFAYDGTLHRLTNHYVGVFSDVVNRYVSGKGNLDYAVALHDRFFDADENRNWDIDRAVIGANIATEK